VGVFSKPLWESTDWNELGGQSRQFLRSQRRQKLFHLELPRYSRYLAVINLDRQIANWVSFLKPYVLTSNLLNLHRLSQEQANHTSGKKNNQHRLLSRNGHDCRYAATGEGTYSTWRT
jgi:hypothetical protein